MSKNRWLILVVALQALFLIGYAGTSYAAEWFGREVRLETAPVDPRDVLYGDYVVLSYEISQLDRTLWRSETSALPVRGDTVYVALRPDAEGIFRPAAFFPNRAMAGGEDVLIKGRVEYSWEHAVTIRYGLERYYVPEGTGKALEEQAGKLLVTVRIAPWGQSVITGAEPRDETTE